MALVDKLNELIAARAGVRPEDVTDEFIRRRRAGRKLDVDDTNDYGGWAHDGLEPMSDEDVEAAKRAFEEMVAEGSKK